MDKPGTHLAKGMEGKLGSFLSVLSEIVWRQINDGVYSKTNFRSLPSMIHCLRVGNLLAELHSIPIDLYNTTVQ